jgi:5-methylcytosine-specific restriction endonuclease McrA
MATENAITKRCRNCGEVKTISNFAKAKTGLHGVRGKCKTCRSRLRIKKQVSEIRPALAICTQCKEEKPFDLGHFKRNSYAKYGLTSECRSCLAIRNKAHYLNNKDQYRAANLAWRMANLDRAREIARNSAKRNRKRINAYVEKWREINKDRHIRNSVLWYEKNKERLKPLRARNRAQNPERYRVYARNHKCKKRGASGTHTKADIIELSRLQKGKCANCQKKLDKYHVDHIEPLNNGGSNDKYNLQLLCPPCNLRKSDIDPLEFARRNARLL